MHRPRDDPEAERAKVVELAATNLKGHGTEICSLKFITDRSNRSFSHSFARARPLLLQLSGLMEKFNNFLKRLGSQQGSVRRRTLQLGHGESRYADRRIHANRMDFEKLVGRRMGRKRLYASG